MIEYKTGDLLREDVDALVNTVNCVGVMGRGIAAQFKKAWPDNFRAYARACKVGEVEPGRMFVFETAQLTGPRFIINFPTKRHWRAKSRIEDIDSGLASLVEEIANRGITSIALPPLGAGLGGLRWDDVRQRMEAALARIEDVKVVIFEPQGAPRGAGTLHATPPRMTPGRAALVGLIERYLAGLLDPFVSLLEVHKLMYFLQEAGEPLRLKFVKAQYGPYGENLRHVMHGIEGVFIRGYGDGGDDPTKPLELMPGADRQARSVLEASATTQEHFARVSRLVDGFESAFGLELLSTVHWVLAHEKPANDEDLGRLVHAWGERKKRFTPGQIGIARRSLDRAGFGA